MYWAPFISHTLKKEILNKYEQDVNFALIKIYGVVEKIVSYLALLFTF